MAADLFDGCFHHLRWQRDASGVITDLYIDGVAEPVTAVVGLIEFRDTSGHIDGTPNG